MRPNTHISVKSVSVIAVAVISGLSISACSILPKPKPASTIYRLSVPEGIKSVTIKDTHVVNIEYPTTSKALAGMDIVLSPDGQRLTAAGGAHWSEPVPGLLRNALIDILASNADVTGIIPKGNTRVPYRLNMDVRRFEAVFDRGEDAAPNAIVQLTLSLTETTARKLVGSYSVKTQSRASAPTVSSIVRAQDEATREAMLDVSNWLSEQLASSE
ncbi:MAG: membrane integrity-associated transporter subunit PqiC [Rhodobacteraceae bacterium]|nr:membrane integrity-associated transporter subunit PqiC [Paracoccaceae bacterium]